jgi:energy-coupling factor transporter ATP-binding protein EcfA2
LLKVYLVTCFNPDITFPSVSINGTNGSGKSTLSRIIKKIIDPSSNELETLPDTIDDLRVRLNQDYYLAFDNLSSISKKQSDFLCAAITGVTSSNRMKYTDNTINSVYIKRGMCLNGISPFVQKADLAERVLFFTAKLIKDTSRISDMTFWKDFSADLPYILGGIFDLYSKAMKILPTVKLQKLQRLADFHLFGYAVAEAMKMGLGKKFNEVLEDNKTRQMEITCQNAMIISLVEDFLKNEEDEGYWKGTMSLLYKSLKDFMSQQNMTEEIYNPRTYPKEANHLSRALHQYEAAFASKGIHFQSKKNSKGNMEIEITTDWLKDDIGTIKRVPIITSKT